MRLINRKLKKLSTDEYLSNFSESNALYLEVRKREHLMKLKSLIKYANAIGASDCLHVDFFYSYLETEN